jgi:hypothetical protein
MTESSPGLEAARDQVPWAEFTPEETAAYYHHQADVADHDSHLPARGPEQREAYDEIDQWRAEAEEADARRDHFEGIYTGYAPHDVQCEDGCPYETPEQARERAEAFYQAEEARAADLEMEAEAG